MKREKGRAVAVATKASRVAVAKDFMATILEEGKASKSRETQVSALV